MHFDDQRLQVSDPLNSDRPEVQGKNRLPSTLYVLIIAPPVTISYRTECGWGLHSTPVDPVLHKGQSIGVPSTDVFDTYK